MAFDMLDISPLIQYTTFASSSTSMKLEFLFHSWLCYRHVGVPHQEKVILFNVNSNKTIHMSSISGTTVHFHSSFFEDKVRP
jgi:hypothetical protein